MRLGDWWPDWTDWPCVIVAGGPSAGDAPLEATRGKAKVIAIGTSVRLAPWADVLYACDMGWWEHYGGAPQFTGIKISQDEKVLSRPEWGVRHVLCDHAVDRIVMRPGVIGWGGNSGFQALNLAVQFGANPIILVGYDMRLDRGSHWHGEHPTDTGLLCNPKDIYVARWRRAVDGVAKVLKRRGPIVLNASPVSALRNYPKVDFLEALSVDHRAFAWPAERIKAVARRDARNPRRVQSRHPARR